VKDVAIHASSRRVICANRLRYPEIVPIILPLALAPWTDDELIEYLRAARPQECASVMRRWTALPDKADLHGNPALLRWVADLLAADNSLTSLRVAIQRIALACLHDREERRIAAECCLAILERDSTEAVRLLGQLAQQQEDFVRLRPLRHPLVQRILAGERIAHLVLNDGECPMLGRKLPRVLVQELATLAARDFTLAERFHAIYASDRRTYHAQVATILYAQDPAWRPHVNRQASLAGGSFHRARWMGLTLPKTGEGASNLSDVDLTQADLQGAMLDSVVAHRVRLSGARLDKASLAGVDAAEAEFDSAWLVAAMSDRINLRGANLKGAVLDDASLAGAELDDADLTGARFRKADLTGATLLGCKIVDADFTGANLTGCTMRELVLREAILEGAAFPEADLSRCDLEGIRLEAADFCDARLVGAILTGSILPRAKFRRAKLGGTGLADIHWEDADLRDADLRYCSFHMGSTRSGLVGSPYPGHGSKTGFYTDDYHDQGFKRPEEIRKANLCGADLRGARLDGVDFYLVHLRDAQIDDDALEQVVRTGGILYDRCT
jgi:uncharacterized protein YjbI with pentapeptide repeats